MTKPQDELLRRHTRSFNHSAEASGFFDPPDAEMHRGDYMPVPSSPGFLPSHTNQGIWPTIRLSLVVLSIGAGSLVPRELLRTMARMNESPFSVALDSVVDNLLPPAHAFLMNIYDNSHEADFAWEWICASRIYGLAVGCFLSVFLANQPSRKYPLITALALNFFGGAVSGLVRHVPHGVFVSCVGRFINGIGSGIAQVIGLAMIADISPIRFRGTMLATTTVWACIGELIGMLLGLEICLGTESSVAHRADRPQSEFGRLADVFGRFLSEFRADQYVETERLLRKSSASSLRTEHLLHSIKKRFHSGSFLRPLLLGSYVLTFVHVDDWLWISYSTQVFENIGWSAKSATTTSLFIVIPQAIISVLTLCFFDRFSRRTLIILPTVASIFCSTLAIIGLSYGHLFGILPVYLIVPVLAAVDLSAAAIASEGAIAFGGVLTATLLTVVNTYGTQFVLGPFILMNVFYIIGVHKWLPETNGISATAIAKQFSENIPTIFHQNFFTHGISYLCSLYGRGKAANLFLFVVQVSLLSIMFYFFVYSGRKLLFS
ncbi:MFS domain-containing protein [Aphelenchoides fujianensis]|nr:MFS domain-containing protein [Aphelenchoides fujianensis]